MWRSKKFIIIALLAAVVLVGSIGGVVLAQTENGNDSGPRARFGALVDRVCEFYNANPDRPCDIDADVLKAAFAEARSEMEAERPEGRPSHRPMVQVFASFGIEQEAVKAAFEQVRAELEDGTLESGREVVMARVLEILGIDQEDWQAALAEARSAMQAERPEGFGFKRHGGFRGMGGPRGFDGPCVPAE